MKSPNFTKISFFFVLLLIALLFAAVPLKSSGLAGEQKSVETETTVTYPEGDSTMTAHEPGQEPVVVERETTVVEEDEEPEGILSTTVNVLGDIIALPFRLVAGLFRLIF